MSTEISHKERFKGDPKLTDSVALSINGKDYRLPLSKVKELFTGSDEAAPLEYTALLAQAGVAAPTEVAVLKNTLGGTPAWSYSAQGIYILTLAGAFTQYKTVIFATSSLAGTTIAASWNDADSIYISTYGDVGGVADDDLLGDATNPASITILVYP